MIIGDWGLGIGDWESPIPNPQSPIPKTVEINKLFINIINKLN